MTISIRGARADRGMGQAQVAERLGVSVSTYSVLERHPERITWARAEQLAAILGRDIREFSFYPTGEVTPDDDDG